MIRSRNFTLLFFIALLLVGASLRLWNLWERGLFIHDEAHLMNVASSYRVGFTGLVARVFDTESEFKSVVQVKEHLRRFGGSLFTAGKPGHAILLTLLSFVTGVNDVTPLLLSAIAGVGCVVLLFFIGARLWSSRIGLAASALLAASAFHVEFSRNGMAFADSVFFVLLSFHLFLLGKDAGSPGRANLFRIGAGLAASAAFACHYNTFWIIALLIALNVWEGVKKKIPHKSLVSGTFILFFMFLLPLVMIESSLQVVKSDLRYSYPHYKTYFGEIKYILSHFHSSGGFVEQMKGSRVNFSQPLYFFSLILRKEGILFLGILLTGIVSFIAKVVTQRRHPDMLVLFLFAFPLVLWTLYAYREERTFLLLIPFACIITVVGVEFVFEKLLPHSGRLPLLLVCSIVVVSGIVRSLNGSMRERSNYPQAVHISSDYAVHHHLTINEQSFSWHSAPAWRFYFREEVQRIPELGDLVNLQDKEDPGLFFVDELARLFPEEEFYAGRDFEQLDKVAVVPATANLGEVEIYTKKKEDVEKSTF